LESEHVNI
jgi:hypothetical protein